METHDGDCSEVLKDFKEALARLDFTSYNPQSQEFDTALRLGLMWRVLDCMDGNDRLPDIVQKELPKDDIAGKISSAKKYLQKYIDTGDESFRGVASDELRHAGMLVRKAGARLPGAEEKKRLKEYETEIQEVTSRIA